MREQGCPREVELLDALQASARLDALEPTLREHAAGCAACAELMAVAAPLLDEHQALMQEANVPSSAIVWWRAQMRSRREATVKATEPITIVQGIAFACFAGLLATALGIFVPTFRRSIGWMMEAGASWSGLQIPVAAAPLTNPIVLAAVVALGLCALVLPLALYFAFQED